jgi:hypothetical protein
VQLTPVRIPAEIESGFDSRQRCNEQMNVPGSSPASGAINRVRIPPEIESGIPFASDEQIQLE